jgi:hypothetical protein
MLFMCHREKEKKFFFFSELSRFGRESRPSGRKAGLQYYTFLDSRSIFPAPQGRKKLKEAWLSAGLFLEDG